MDWKKIIAQLTEGPGAMTQAEIATACGVAQATVSDLLRGATKTPNFDFGSRLHRLHQMRSRKPKQAA